MAWWENSSLGISMTCGGWRVEEDETRREQGADRIGNGKPPRDFKLGSDVMIFIVEAD